jgi:hypothetical protein
MPSASKRPAITTAPAHTPDLLEMKLATGPSYEMAAF